jgi:hypothetical protein
MTFVEQHKATTFVIRHFVFFSAQEGQLEVVLEGLKILEKIPHADLVEVRLNACDPIVNYDLSPTRAHRSHYSTVIHTGQWSDGFSIARSV